MAKRKLSEKYNDSCIRIFELLKLFAQGEAQFSDVIKLFSKDKEHISQISNVILNKYLNTLKIFGIKIRKNKGVYYLMQMPFSISLNKEELRTVTLIKMAQSMLPEGKTKDSVSEFLNELEKRYDFDTKKLSALITPSENYDLSFYFSKFEKQIATLEKYCQDEYLHDIYYNDEEGNLVGMIAVPQEIKYHENLVTLEVYNPRTQMVFEIPVESIRTINTLDIKFDKDAKKSYAAVEFVLSGDLAKRYRLREWEKTEGIDKNGELKVINKGEDINSLMVRLFKYGENCRVLTPKYIQKTILKRLDKTLKNYDI